MSILLVTQPLFEKSKDIEEGNILKVLLENLKPFVGGGTLGKIKAHKLE